MFDDQPPPANKINGFFLHYCQPINFDPGHHMYKTN